MVFAHETLYSFKDKDLHELTAAESTMILLLCVTPSRIVYFTTQV